jgi:hypothetical protein
VALWLPALRGWWWCAINATFDAAPHVFLLLLPVLPLRRHKHATLTYISSARSTFSYTWTYGGPVSLVWGWIIIVVMNLFVGLALSELASCGLLLGFRGWWVGARSPVAGTWQGRGQLQSEGA